MKSKIQSSVQATDLTKAYSLPGTVLDYGDTWDLSRAQESTDRKDTFRKETRFRKPTLQTGLP